MLSPQSLSVIDVGVLYYMVFRHDFGEKEHCFSKVPACVYAVLIPAAY